MNPRLRDRNAPCRRPSSRLADALPLAAALLGSVLLLGCAQLAGPAAPQAKAAAPEAKAPAPAASAAASAPAGPASAPAVAASAAASAASAPRPPASVASAPVPGAPRPFAEIVRDAKETKGLFSVWEKDEKVWLEIRPEQFDQLLFMQVNMNQGLPSSYWVARRMFRGQPVMFRKIGNNVQLVARNLRNVAPAGTPQALALAQNTSDSLVGSAAVASLPHPERKSVLIEMNGILLADLLGIGTALDASYRTGYALDARNSYFERVRAKEASLSFFTKLHFAVPKIPAPPPTPTPNPAALPSPQTDTPDARSFFLGFHVNFTKLPEQPMTPRLADGRVGHFNTQQWDFTSEKNDRPQRWLVNRWRLEKKDPQAALSEPKKPITFWLDKNIPLEYRDAVRAGVLEWNKAFEKIGFKDAIRVEQQKDDADFDTDETHYASVRWVVDYLPGALAVGPSVVDPRSGEILDADISIGHGWTRLPRFLTRYQFNLPTAASTRLSGAQPAEILEQQRRLFLAQAGWQQAAGSAPAHVHSELCNHANEMMDEALFGMDLLYMRGMLDPEGPEAEAIVRAVLKDVVTHEVGHTLGLRHNFRASTIYPLDKLKDPAFTRVNGLSGSVMEYNAWNIAREGERQGEYVMSTLGPYDYWAVEYAYKPIAPEREQQELAEIAARGAKDPLLAYATDEELAGDFDGMDPTVHQRDLGSDPLAFAERRVALSRELIERMAKRGVKPGESYGILLQTFRSAYRNMELALGAASKYVGGQVFVRDYGGSGRNPYTPVPAKDQRRALKLLVDTLFAPQGFRMPPDLVAKLAPDSLERGYTPPFDIQPDEIWLTMQERVLDRLLSPFVEARITQAAAKVAKPGELLGLAELYGSIHKAVWGDLKPGADIPAPRRALQREHVRRLVQSLVKPSALGQADARALNRLNATELLGQIRKVRATSGLSREAQAHLAECETLLADALKAALVRAN